MAWNIKTITLPILIGVSLSGVSAALLYLLLRKVMLNLEALYADILNNYNVYTCPERVSERQIKILHYLYFFLRIY